MSSPFADPSHPLAYRAGQLIHAADIKLERKIATPDSVNPITPVAPVNVDYKGLRWEAQSPIDKPDKDDSGASREKTLFTYDKSLVRLRKAGFERHPRPSEAFGLIIDGLEGKLSGQLQGVQGDMMKSYGEWLSVAFEVQTKANKQTLLAYLDPEGIVWKDDTYVRQKSFKYARVHDFDVTGITLDNWTELSAFNPALVQFLYTKPFQNLPDQIKTAAGIYLPAEGVLWPVGRGYVGFNGNFNVVGNYDDGASRGVAAQKNSGKKQKK